MNSLADVVLEYFWFLNFCADDELDPDTAVKAMENLAYTIDTSFSETEKSALQDAATRSLAQWLREPDEHGYTPRKLLTAEQREFLESIAAGHFSGPPLEEDQDG
jgi:hypothetical protein